MAAEGAAAGEKTTPTVVNGKYGRAKSPTLVGESVLFQFENGIRLISVVPFSFLRGLFASGKD